ncbi:MAG TPA: hypothetical protein VM938_03130 [Acidimicrobiales bacterium]|nr:hypothetical protein [Acidimicrobiales bacterium]
MPGLVTQPLEADARTPNLSDKEKAEAITVATIAIVVVVSMCMAYGFSDVDNDTKYPSREFFTIEFGVLLVGARLARLGATIFGRRPSTAGQRGGVVALWAITLGNYGALGILVQQTGGATSSPFATLLVAVIALSPYIMTGALTPWLNLIGGLGFFGWLLSETDQATALPGDVAPWVYWSTTALIAFISVYFVARAREQTLADAITLSARRVGSLTHRAYLTVRGHPWAFVAVALAGSIVAALLLVQ